ncbi:MAG: hypothetical protein ACHQCI_03735 [Solirubrobacterales bacterium]
MTTAAGSPAEELERAIEGGWPVERGNGEAVDTGKSWGDDRTLPAAALYELLTQPASGAAPRAAVLVGLRISGRLNLHAVQLKVPLICHGCYFDEPVNLMTATAVEIMLTGCHLPALAANRLITRGNLNLSMSTLEIVSLLGAHIGGQLSLNSTTLTGGSYPLELGDGTLYPRQSLRAASTRTEVALRADGLRVDGGIFCREGFEARGEVRLPGAHIGGQLSLDKATLRKGLSGYGLRVDRDMFCQDGFEAKGEVDLRRAHIAGVLSLDKATLGQGLYGEGLRVDGSMHCRNGFEAKGLIYLQGARIAGQLEFDKATLGQGLSGNRLQVGSSMFCRNGFEAKGLVYLQSARIAGQLEFDNATLGQGLSGYGLRVGGDMFCRDGFEAQREVSLRRAHIAGVLSFARAKPISTSERALSLDGARVDEDLVLCFTEHCEGEISLTNAHIGRLLDSENAWPKRLRLGGLEYDAVRTAEGQDPGERHNSESRKQLEQRWRVRHSVPDVELRLRWIRLAEESQGDGSGANGYAPQPYTQLIAFYRREGRDGEARRVAYERECRHRSQHGMPRKAWNTLLRLTVGYGYRPLRALAILGVLVLVGTLAFSRLHADGDISAIRDNHPPFVAGIYTLDQLIPVVTFGLRDAFASKGLAQWLAFVYTLFGWVLSIAVIAGLNAAVRRD